MSAAVAREFPLLLSLGLIGFVRPKKGRPRVLTDEQRLANRRALERKRIR